MQAFFTFHGALKELFRGDSAEYTVSLSFNYGQSVKHLIESLGVPHVEIDRIEVDDAPVDLDYLVEDHQRVDVYPPRLPILLDGEARFILDNHLGRLAGYLRMLGFDCLYDNDAQDEMLARTASQEARLLLTRDRRLLMRNLVQQGYWVRSMQPSEQLVEIVHRYGLAQAVQPFLRCIRCNALLQPVEKSDVDDRLQPLTRRYFEVFRICPACQQIYWKGSHYERMQNFIEQTLEKVKRMGYH